MALDGTYKGLAKSMAGAQEGSFVFKTEGDVLTGRVEAMGMAFDIQGGKVDGNKFSGFVEGDSGMGKMKMTLEGTYDGVDTVKGTLRAKIGGARFECTRVKE